MSAAYPAINDARFYDRSYDPGFGDPGLPPVGLQAPMGWPGDRATSHPSNHRISMVRAYKLAFTSTATGNASATVQIPRNGTILGVNWGISIISGAGVDGRMQWELSTASVSTITTNDTPGNSLSQVAIGNTIASSTAAINVAHPIGVSVNAGDKIYVHTNAAGTAPGSVVGSCIVFVNH